MDRREIDTTERPLVLIWEVSRACELACKHCLADAEPRRHPDELTTAEGKQLLAEVRRFGDGQLVVLSGDDPLAREDTLDLVNYGTDIGLQMTLTPSGTTSLTPERVQALADTGLRRMALSIDGGSAAAHDEFRQERGSFEQTLHAAGNRGSGPSPTDQQLESDPLCAYVPDEYIGLLPEQSFTTENASSAE